LRCSNRYFSSYFPGLTESYNIVTLCINDGAVGSQLNVDVQTLYNVLVPGGKINLIVPSSTNIDELKLNLTLAGFINISSDVDAASNTLSFTATRPEWTGANATKVLLRKKDTTKLANNESAQSSILSQLQAIGGDDLIDEDSLLAAAPLPSKAPVEGCATKRRACANCSCGRKEQEDKIDASSVTVDLQESTPQVTSSCGNCYKGDAFRCASCPYLGKPAFKPGTDGAVMLASVSDDI
jgi:anamorsin